MNDAEIIQKTNGFNKWKTSSKVKTGCVSCDLYKWEASPRPDLENQKQSTQKNRYNFTPTYWSAPNKTKALG